MYPHPGSGPNMSRLYKIATTTANLGISAAAAWYQLPNPGNTDFLGISATNSTGAPYYIKLYWTGNQNFSITQFSSVITNAACTIVPTLTIQVPTTGLYTIPAENPPTGAGQLYFWAVSTAADATNTSLSAGGDAIAVFYD